MKKMRKILAVAVCAAMAVTMLAGCGGNQAKDDKKADETATEQKADEATEAADQKAADENAEQAIEGDEEAADSAMSSQMANPWEECDSLEAAEKIADFDLTLPFDATAGDEYSAIKGEMIQVVHKADGALTVRKGVGPEQDVSGDYNSYAYVNTADGITLKGVSEEEVVLAMWSDGDYAYAISCSDPVAAADVIELVEKTK